MVMEASPSPQSVGREFVRQYYTLLNKAPAHLHRFYNNFSSFVHGGLDAPNRETLPVVGQKQIHNRIQQLNFRDCHAKISQVDSQATLGNGVVVQVTGELSNGGAPMRRFTQTFVLAAQSPKKYYVHNDIFRYQDIVFSDEEGSGSARSEGEEDEPRGYFPPPPYPPAAAFPAPPPAPLDPPAPHHLNGHPPAAAPQPPPEDAGRHLVNALHAPTSVEREPEPAPASPPAPRAATPPPPAAPPAPEEPEPQPEPPRDPEPRPATPLPAAPPSPPAPKTYANLLKSGGAPQAPAPPAVHTPAPALLSHRHHAPQQVTSAPAVQTAPPPTPPAPHEPRPRPQRAPRDLPPPPAEGSVGAPGGGGAGPTRRYSDAQQLFLGNLPHAATEDALRTLFSRFGAIAELRVHSKPAAPGAPRHPNYGFITYESSQAALDCLTAAPLYFEDVKLNVEEKKARGREPPRRRPPSAHRPPFPRAPYRR